MNEHMHVIIESPNQHRKELLGINMGMINVLQRLEKIQKIRAKKTVQVNKLSLLTKRISRDIAELKRSLPSDKEPGFLKEGKKMKKAMEEKPAKEEKSKKEAVPVDTDRLSMELRKLKEKIEAL